MEYCKGNHLYKGEDKCVRCGFVNVNRRYKDKKLGTRLPEAVIKKSMDDRILRLKEYIENDLDKAERLVRLIEMRRKDLKRMIEKRRKLYG